MTPSREIARLIDIMAALRDPGSGCAWDLSQTFDSLIPFVIEEAYEVVDAVERGDREDLRDELGDLLLQVVFQARLAEEEGSFDFGGVVEAITTKLIRRHPHIFGDRRDLTPEDVRRLWAEVKTQERLERARADPASVEPGLLGSVRAGLPAFSRATRLQTKAAEVGFDWNDTVTIIAKIREETDEVAAALGEPAALEEEIGDLVFAVVNLARHAKVDPEAALRRTNRKFESRFAFIEREIAARGGLVRDTPLADMEALWQAAKSSPGSA